MARPKQISTLAPTRGATFFLAHSLKFNINFNSRPYTRGDERNQRHSAGHLYFNSRPYTRGDFVNFFSWSCHSIFQLSPLHEGRPVYVWCPFRVYISTLAPTRGATGFCPLCHVAIIYFNSRPYTRGDLKMFGYSE